MKKYPEQETLCGALCDRLSYDFSAGADRGRMLGGGAIGQ